MTEENKFLMLSKINVNDHVEKKMGLSYLSWPFAVAELMKADPCANWQFHEPTKFGETLMVSCTVTAFCKSMTMHLPVMDHRNQAIKNPDAFAVNKNMMRCLVKAIACHGLGLYIYAGEDLPEGDAAEPTEGKKVAQAIKKAKPTDGMMESLSEDRQKAVHAMSRSIVEKLAQDNEWGAYETYVEVKDNDEKAALWSLLDSKQRAALKAKHEAEMAGAA